MEKGSYESSDPDQYAHALDLVDAFESLPDDENKELILERARALNFGAPPDGVDGIGIVEAIAQAMQESKDSQQLNPPQPN